jgi:hypothetical protein
MMIATKGGFRRRSDRLFPHLTRRSMKENMALLNHNMRCQKYLYFSSSAPLRDGHFAQVGRPAHASVLLCVRKIHT